MKVAVVVGTRPDIIKTAPIIKEIQKRKNLELSLIHTSQHFDDNMSNDFIKELGLPKPDTYLGAGHKEPNECYQIGWCIPTIYDALHLQKPDVVVVTGDTNSALAASIAASKMNIPVAHIEAGCRTFDKTQSEEINRILVDHMAKINFAPTSNCDMNLLREGLHVSSYMVGHPLVDLLHEITIRRYSGPKKYAFMTLHRRENITDKDILSNIMNNISKVSSDIDIIFACHPHTKKQMEMFGIDPILHGLLIIDPVTYMHSLSLIKHAKFVITDSGGIIQEAAILGTPCVSIIDVTGWVETVQAGVNFLVGSNIHEKMYDIIFKIMNGDIERKQTNLFGKVGVSKKIVDILEV